MKKYIIIIFSLFSCLSGQLLAQNALMQDYKGLLNYINSVENIAYDGQYLYYASTDAEKPEKTMPIKVVKTKGKLYMKFGETEFLMIGKKAIVVDHEQKAMHFQNNLDIPEVFNFAKLDAIQQYEGFKAEKFAAQQGLTGLRFSNPKYSKTSIELLYRSDINMITFSKMIFDVDNGEVDADWNKKKIEASFYNHQLSNVAFSFTFADYFSSKGKKISGAKNCKGYQII